MKSNELVSVLEIGQSKMTRCRIDRVDNKRTKFSPTPSYVPSSIATINEAVTSEPKSDVLIHYQSVQEVPQNDWLQSRQAHILKYGSVNALETLKHMGLDREQRWPCGHFRTNQNVESTGWAEVNEKGLELEQNENP